MKYKSDVNLEEILQIEKKKFADIKKEGYKVDIARGKPCKEQLDAVMPFFTDFVGSHLEEVVPYRNYGELEGIKSARELFAQILGIESDEVIIGGNSSLNFMYDTIQRAFQYGILGNKPWSEQGVIKFLCPSPGYDRHFAICEQFKIQMLTVPMKEDGPDMDIIENLVANDKSIKGMWCVPKYSNPTGITYSDEVVKRMANMKVAANDFRIFWDNAYVVHDLYESGDQLLNIMDELKKAENENRIYMFTSTSKITFPGAGISCFAASKENIKDVTSHLKYQTICYNKINQFMHVSYIKDMDNLKKIMQNHAAIIRPKFETIISVLEKEFGRDSDIVKWTEPKGGYFISLDLMERTAARVYSLCKEAGLTITNAGATFPYGNDPKDSNIRVAPTFTSSTDLDIACKILVNCIKIACCEKLLAK